MKKGNYFFQGHPLPDVPEHKRMLWLAELHETIGHPTEAAMHIIVKDENNVRLESIDSDISEVASTCMKF